jgi:hypothetical protein
MWAESQNFNQSQELQQIPRISQALVVLDPDLDLEDWHPHPALNAVLQRRQDPDTPKGLQSTIAGKAVVRSLFLSYHTNYKWQKLQTCYCYTHQLNSSNTSG